MTTAATATPKSGIRLIPDIYAKRKDLDLDEIKVLSPEEAITALSKSHTKAEFFRGDYLTKFYFDSEEYYIDPPTDIEKYEYLNEITKSMDNILEDLQDALNEAREEKDGINEEQDNKLCFTYKIATRHGPLDKDKDNEKNKKKSDGFTYKLSFRAFVSGVYTIYHKIPFILRYHFLEEVNLRKKEDKDGKNLELWDTSVYKESDATLCAIGGHKTTKDLRVLTRGDVRDDLLLYVAGHIEPDWPFIPCNAKKTSNSSSERPVTYSNKESCPRILSLIDLLGKNTSDDRPSWVKVGIFLKNLGGPEMYLDAWMEFSKKSEKYNYQKCLKDWESFSIDKDHPHPVKEKRIRAYAKNDSPQQFAEWIKRPKEPKEIETSVVDLKKLLDIINLPYKIDVIHATRLESDTIIVDATLNSEICTIQFNLKDLNVTITKTDSTVLHNGRIHENEAIEVVGPDIASLHKDIPPGQKWALTHENHIVKMSTASTVVQLLNKDSKDESIKIDCIYSRKNHLISNTKANQPKMNLVKTAYSESIQNSLQTIFGHGWPLNIIGNNNVVTIVNQPQANPKDERTPDSEFYFTLQDSKIFSEFIAKEGNTKDPEFYVFNKSTGIWKLGVANDAAFVLRMAANSGGRLQSVLSEADRKFLKSYHGPIQVVKSLIPKLINPKIQWDILPDGCTPFDNGMFNAKTKVLSPFNQTDYISTTIGYEYSYPIIDDPNVAFVNTFYEQVFPVLEERNYFLRVMATTLFNKVRAKMFLVLSDVRDGNNGKTTVMRAMEHVFGNYKARAERDFLYESTQVSHSGTSANFLSYINKRLAFFDEPSGSDSKKRLDIRRLKDLTSGDSKIVGRQLHSKEVTEGSFEALIVLACNESNFPAFDATDVPFLKRPKVLKMRSLFSANHQEPILDELIFPLKEGDFKETLNHTAKMAHFHLLVDAYQSYLDNGCKLIEPECIVEMVQKIVETADPRIPRALAFIDENINFNPVRTTEFIRKKYYAWITTKELFERFWGWYMDPENSDNYELRRSLDRSQNDKRNWKLILKRAFTMRNRVEISIKPSGPDGQIGGSQNSIDRICWI